MATATQERSTKKLGEVARIGNLTKDFELSFSDKGTPYAQGGLAVDTPKTPGDWAGERQTTFIDLVVFRSLAENAAACLKKGMRVVVVGDAEVESWTGDDGKARSSKRILVTGIGPDLRWATAIVNKASRNGHAANVVARDEAEPF